jgi:hypothetical protein
VFNLVHNKGKDELMIGGVNSAFGVLGGGMKTERGTAGTNKRHQIFQRIGAMTKKTIK